MQNNQWKIIGDWSTPHENLAHWVKKFEFSIVLRYSQRNLQKNGFQVGRSECAWWRSTRDAGLCRGMRRNNEGRASETAGAVSLKRMSSETETYAFWSSCIRCESSFGFTSFASQITFSKNQLQISDLWTHLAAECLRSMELVWRTDASRLQKVVGQGQWEAGRLLQLTQRFGRL